MKFTIVHLYSDLLNLYGASGNLKVLSTYLQKQGVKVKILKKSINDEIDYDSVDMIYLGSGTEESLELARKDILMRKAEVTDFIKAEKFFFAEGNSLELLCNSINGQEALAVYDYDVKYGTRIRKEVAFDSALITEKLYGFVNSYSLIEKNDVIDYGFVINNLYASYLLGPLFARNPHFCEWYVNRVMKYIDSEYIIEDFFNSLDRQAFDEFKNIIND